ncbi:uncharacterized protein FRV6_02734 [Fusarium oxysporum]|uniref:Uncharacterized protein n=1 Tax=Fusarium oxysporum TaxID=5507 RepID=A0A2H3SQT6_FUSOX|nr:uncharacterized protein FRV6_02734 [Fusarium oxysporum]
MTSNKLQVMGLPSLAALICKSYEINLKSEAPRENITQQCQLLAGDEDIEESEENRLDIGYFHAPRSSEAVIGRV